MGCLVEIFKPSKGHGIWYLITLKVRTCRLTFERRQETRIILLKGQNMPDVNVFSIQETWNVLVSEVKRDAYRLISKTGNDRHFI